MMDRATVNKVRLATMQAGKVLATLWGAATFLFVQFCHIYGGLGSFHWGIVYNEIFWYRSNFALHDHFITVEPRWKTVPMIEWGDYCHWPFLQIHIPVDSRLNFIAWIILVPGWSVAWLISFWLFKKLHHKRRAFDIILKRGDSN